jgi:hypothetical protein
MRRQFLSVLWCIAAPFCAGAALAQENIREGLWEISVRMDMGGQPASAEPMVLRQCITRQSAQGLMSQLTGGGGCEVSGFQQDGNRARWNLSCSGQMTIDGTGEVTVLNERFDGTLNVQVGMGGQSIPMVQHFTARRVGECQ